MEQSIHRLPALEHAEIRLMVNGPESFTPDMRAMLGESPQVCVCLCLSPLPHMLCAHTVSVLKMMLSFRTISDLRLWDSFIESFFQKSKGFFREPLELEGFL